VNQIAAQVVVIIKARYLPLQILLAPMGRFFAVVQGAIFALT